MDNRNLSQTPGSLLPNVAEGGPVFPGDDPAQIPAVPLPNPGEGGPVFPGAQPLPPSSGFVLPNSAVRFVNAARGYPPLRVSIGGTRVASLLSPGESSCYSRVAAGVKTVTVIGTDGYIFLQQQVTFRAARAYIAVISSRNSGLDLILSEDTCF